MVDRGGDYIYNQEFEAAERVIDSLSEKLPDHPIVPMMRAMSLAWTDQPLRTSSPVYPEHEKYLLKTISLSEQISRKDSNNLEAMFFEMSAHGLLAEYYAQEGSSFKAMTQAKQTYNLIKKTMEHTSESSELFFLAGLYNYFREKYPERHPVYKSFVWVFKSGDIDRGLIQLDSAVHHSKIVKIEASLYLSYIWLRYENRPDKARYYLERLYKMYPANDYFKAKYLECLMRQKDYRNAIPLIHQLQRNEKPYYKMCGEVFQGVYMEKVGKSFSDAKWYYQRCLSTGSKNPDRGEYYRSIAYLGLGRVAEANGEKDLAAEYYKKTIDLDETDWLTDESETRLEKMD
ncbi:tetratricopeptide repeat protein [Reichenbachiella carrageenanivorans]|uniref:Tetratricopeptide repeat protein n=1 Tax=Reichenbachiella carrageenanivorans TaxID=2979869 RepID=A0ABY6D834_9BACT|nr:tetratricopeptide repeat protein [Reichenbachiella carrageenanivorans]UXX81333.1 tetratricopeptide repeat protein [Reichenbachiella carrageenanivorans]